MIFVNYKDMIKMEVILFVYYDTQIMILVKK